MRTFQLHLKELVALTYVHVYTAAVQSEEDDDDFADNLLIVLIRTTTATTTTSTDSSNKNRKDEGTLSIASPFHPLHPLTMSPSSVVVISVDRHSVHVGVVGSSP